ncbi:hypothetical protein CANINC_001393 [Pichia inconspicua]|uniref:Uncharacterized protein n=1 Tax=Pichia inconspicua TaxID=52247 RepID=A0A4T0X5F0_9ASCO|nr:hypothetical protein CANINC_001393 [[Candida] inconspicua]
MGFLDKLKAAFNLNKDNENRLLVTENNKQQFGIPTNDEPRNRMMDTVSNEQGAIYAREQANGGADISDKLDNDPYTLKHTLANEDAERFAQGDDTIHSDPPKNKLLDTRGNEESSAEPENNVENVALNSDRLK